jgi:hypothetical protein
MSIARRTFLRGGLATAGGALLVERTATVARAATAQYPVNRSPLRPSACSQGRAVHRVSSANAVQLDNTPKRRRGKVLGVDGMSHANSARVVRFDHSGTADHLWRLS